MSEEYTGVAEVVEGDEQEEEDDDEDDDDDEEAGEVELQEEDDDGVDAAEVPPTFASSLPDFTFCLTYKDNGFWHFWCSPHCHMTS